MFLEKPDFNGNIEIYSDNFDDFDDKIQMNEIPKNKNRMKNIKCIDLHQKETNELMSSHLEMLKMRGKLFIEIKLLKKENIRAF